MDIHTITEQAYKNGYEQGYKDGRENSVVQIHSIVLNNETTEAKIDFELNGVRRIVDVPMSWDD